MAQLLVRNLESQLKVRLQRQAKKHGRSMEEEAREILRNALREEGSASYGLGTAIAALFRKRGLHDDMPELRGHGVTTTSYEP